MGCKRRGEGAAVSAGDRSGLAYELELADMTPRQRRFSELLRVMASTIWRDGEQTPEYLVAVVVGGCRALVEKQPKGAFSTEDALILAGALVHLALETELAAGVEPPAPGSHN